MIAIPSIYQTNEIDKSFLDSSFETKLIKGEQCLANLNLSKAIEIAQTAINSLDSSDKKCIPYLILLGESYLFLDQFALSANHFFEALHLLKDNPQEELKAKAIIGLSYNARFISNYTLAITYAEEAILLDSNFIGNKINALLSKGISQSKSGDFDAGITTIKEAILISNKTKDPYFEASCLKALGDAYFLIKDYEQSNVLLKQALVLADQISHYILQTTLLIKIGDVESITHQKNNVNFFVKALALAKKNNFIEGEVLAYKSLSDHYAGKNEKELAYECLKKSIDLNEKTEVIKNNFYSEQIEFVKQYRDKELFLLDQIAEKHTEIKDSINYAQRIQKAIIPNEEKMKTLLGDTFVFYKPKDVVAGDFYWLEQFNNKVIFAVADSTGHGVPGALVSIICNNALNNAVGQFGLGNPGEILDKTLELLVKGFADSMDDIKDGMDIALCTIENNQLMYSGANNPLWIVRGIEVIEIKPNKQPVGHTDVLTPFRSHTFTLQEGDTIYLFTDGYIDQFGGVKGKKFKLKSFRELIISIQDLPMLAQKTQIESRFNEWKGDLEQVDDVCVLGLKVGRLKGDKS